MKRSTLPAIATCVSVLSGISAAQVGLQTSAPSIKEFTLVTGEAPMVRGDTANADAGWTVTPLFTVSEFIGAFQPTGILDGIYTYEFGNKNFVLVNSELGAGNGYPYTLKSGAMLTGARITRFKVTRDVSSGTPVVGLGRTELAYDTIYDRYGQIVVDAAQVNETGNAIDGLARLCSANGAAPHGAYSFEDEIYFAGEENGKPFAPHGGSQWALDVRGKELWAVPAMGRMAWENTTPMETGDPDTVALLCGDDTQAAPLYLWIGQKHAIGSGSFLDRNGLEVGSLYAWKADNGDLTPEDFNGLNSVRTGTWVEVTVQDPAMAGMPGYDAQGYADIDTLQNEADALGCFSFSRPEDVSTNPLDGTQAVFASTGRGGLYPSDNWGTTYVVDVDFSAMTATLVIVHDADGLAVPDAGIRSPDNLDWAKNGKIYIQEDRSTSPSSLFGAATGIEASIWELDPVTRVFTRIAEVDRSAVAPVGSSDNCIGSIGCWETSGILDVTDEFDTLPGERLLLGTVQAHGVEDGPIGGNALLDEGGQLVFISKVGQD